MKRMAWFGWLALLWAAAFKAAAQDPVVFWFTPASGPPGTSVFIQGDQFDGVSDVFFNNTRAIFSVVSTHLLAATVPLDASTGTLRIQAGASFADSADSFMVAPRIASFSPANGPPGTELILDGANFTDAGLSVRFGGIRAQQAFVVGPTQMRVTVPANAASGPIEVATAAGRARSDISFQVTRGEPLLDDFSPLAGAPGTTVTINGRFLGGATAVAFNNSPALFTVIGPTQIQTIAPPDATPGFISITSQAGAGVSQEIFNLTSAPVIENFTPSSGPPGAEIVLNGINFSGLLSADVHGVAASFVVIGPTQLRVTVPAGATSGPIHLTNRFGAGATTNDFLVGIIPTISDFSPDFGPPGTFVTIFGENFTGVSAVLFAGRPASTFSVIAPTEMRAVVPDGATNGPISVLSSEARAASGSTFRIVSSAPEIFDFSPIGGLPGAQVILSGANFSGVTELDFNGQPSDFFVTAPTQITATVPRSGFTGPIRVGGATGAAASADFFFLAPRLAGFLPAEGLAGTNVAIFGTNLLGAIAVAFNGIPAAFQIQSSNLIAAAVPLEAISGNISVTTPAGIVAATNQFLVLPHVAGFFPLAGPAGTTVTISGSGFGNVRAVFFDGAAAAFIPISATQLSATVPPGAAIGLIRVQTLEGVAQSQTSFIIRPSADLLVRTQLSPARLFAGSPTTLSLIVTNQGPSPAPSVVLTNRMAGPVQILSIRPDQGFFLTNENWVVWEAGGLPAGAAAKLDLVLEPLGAGDAQFAVGTSSGEFDPDFTNNQLLVTATIQPGLRTLAAELGAGRGVTLSWPAALTNVTLQFSDQIGLGANWRPLNVRSVNDGTRHKIVVSPSEPRRFFRLVILQ